MSLEAERRRGEEARRLLDDPLLSEAFATVEARLRSQWEASAEGETAKRERLWLMVRLLGHLRGILTEAAETGRLADLQLRAIEAARDPEQFSAKE